MDYKVLAQLLFPDVTDTPQSLEEKYPLRTLPEGAIVTRMAPSPTGFVHLGNLVQGLTAERMAHQSEGVLFLRVEDTDAKREVPGAVEVLIETLKHYGITFDEGATIDGDFGNYGPYRQRQRAAIYHVYAKQLVEQGMAYPCFCTEEQLSARREQLDPAKETTGYYGKYAMWRDRSVEEIKEQLDAGNPWVLRFRSTGSIENQFKFDDLVKGKLTITENDIDHVLLKSDGIPTYHFAHAVDDHLMRTTHVVRGDEWLPTLPFHIQLFNALGFKLPKYVHIGPLMKMDGTSKRKLSKRKDPELALTYYKAEGFPVDAVYEYIMTLLNSNFEDWSRANPDAPADTFKFSPKKLNPAGSLFDYAKLTDVSKNVICKMDAERVYTLL
ncbi:MAG: glutamate--tRNA ligase, partial [Clostridia bacterium]|nr:glutamate--tRNA ligase [Clostridia bacterium]